MTDQRGGWASSGTITSATASPRRTAEVMGSSIDLF
jgi:hypothetical protein